MSELSFRVAGAATVSAASVTGPGLPGFLRHPKQALANVPAPVSMCAAVLYAAIPWATLALQRPLLSPVLTVDLIERFGLILFGAFLVGMFLRAQRRHNQPWVIFTHVVAGAVFLEGQFACHYFVISTIWPGSFTPPLSRIDAAYFTICTATTTGLGDIYPASPYARLIVSAQMVFSFILLAIAIGTALQHEIARADRRSGGGVWSARCSLVTTYPRDTVSQNTCSTLGREPAGGQMNRQRATGFGGDVHDDDRRVVGVESLSV